MLVVSCASSAASAEEYFSIGMAYFELGKFPEAERWLNRAASVKKTMIASEYNLGRIAFESGRYEDAARHFKTVLSKDPKNVMALKAAAYTYIKTGELLKAEELYDQVLALVPESADDGFNYALVLYALGKFDNCEAVLRKYPFALEEKPDALLLLARAQGKANKVEAIDSFDKLLTLNTAQNTQVLYEYAQILEKEELYARALEQYRAGLAAFKDDQGEPKKNRIRFDIARLLLIADPGNAEGIAELNGAVGDGFNILEDIEALLNDNRVEETQKTEISQIIENIKNPPQVQAQSSETDPEGKPDDSEE